MNFLDQVKKWIGEIIEISLMLIALAVVIQILTGSGEQGLPFFGQVVANLTTLIATLGEQGLVGLVALGVIFYLFYRKRGTQQHHG